MLISLPNSTGKERQSDTSGEMRHRSWADLPKELLEIIGTHLDSRIDVYRFRAVCTSWRSSVSPWHKQYPRFRLNLPRPILVAAWLSPIIICRLQDTGSNSNSWLTKVEESTKAEMQLLSPLSNAQISVPTSVNPNTLNVLNFRLLELSKPYCTLKLSLGRPVLGINKAVLFPSLTCSTDDFGILAVFREGKLAYWRNGDKNWRLLDDTNFDYDDIIVYKGQYYVVDGSGVVYWIDCSSFNLVRYSPALYSSGNEKHLVESCGDLYIVDRYLDGHIVDVNQHDDQEMDHEGVEHMNQEMGYHDDLYYHPEIYLNCPSKTIDIKVYRLDEEWGTWVDVKSFGDRVFVVGKECCFSVCSHGLAGWDGNCIYFTDPTDKDLTGEFSNYEAFVFRLRDGSIGKASFSLGLS